MDARAEGAAAGLIAASRTVTLRSRRDVARVAAADKVQCMVQKIERPDGTVLWRKSYGQGSRLRPAANAIWNALVGTMGLGMLRAPSRHVGEAALQTERRRLTELRQAGVPVPAVVDDTEAGTHHGSSDLPSLLISDTGRTLAHQFRRVHDPQARDALVARAAQAIAHAHARGAYLGQAFPRNITLTPTVVAFLDFEDDPGQIMPLADAQARDWLLFTSGVAGRYLDRPQALAALLRTATCDLQMPVRERLAAAARRLRAFDRPWLARGQRIGPLAITATVLRQVFGR